jgi:hypothetical protein
LIVIVHYVYVVSDGCQVILKPMKRIHLFILVLSAVFVFDKASISQASRKGDLNAQEILTRVDRTFSYPQGIVRGVIKHIRPDGASSFLSFKGLIAGEDSLFTFSGSERGDQLKILYNLGGKEIWVYDVLALKLFHKTGMHRYDEILSTNFDYIDFAHSPFQSNYTASVQGPAFVKGIDAYELALHPIANDGAYGGLTMYVSRDRFIPLRIDFLDRDKAVLKVMTVAKVLENDTRTVPIRYDMMNIRRGTVTIMSFTGFDGTATFDREIFRPEKLGG